MSAHGRSTQKVRVHLAHLLDTELDQITPRMCRDLHEGPSRSSGKSSANGVARVLKAILNDAGRTTDLPRNPVSRGIRMGARAFNRQYIGRDDTVKLAELGDVPITWSVWDLGRFERFDRSGQAREHMVIDFASDFGAPLPALKASQTGAALESYLLIAPGEQLVAIYDRWGGRPPPC